MWNTRFLDYQNMKLFLRIQETDSKTAIVMSSVKMKLRKIDDEIKSVYVYLRFNISILRDESDSKRGKWTIVAYI